MAACAGPSGHPIAVALACRPETALSGARGFSPPAHPADAAVAATLRRGSDRRARLAARVLLRACLRQLGEEHAAREAFGRRCALCDGWHGGLVAPCRPGLGLAVAHLSGYVAAIAGPGGVGIDVTHARPDRETAAVIHTEAGTLAERGALRSRLDAARLWARKECLTKAGVTDPAGLTVADAGESADEPGPWSVATAAPGRFAELVTDEHIVVALALEVPVHLHADRIPAAVVAPGRWSAQQAADGLRSVAEKCVAGGLEHVEDGST